jgi:hypothetical protein
MCCESLQRTAISGHSRTNYVKGLSRNLRKSRSHDVNVRQRAIASIWPRKKQPCQWHPWCQPPRRTVAVALKQTRRRCVGELSRLSGSRGVRRHQRQHHESHTPDCLLCSAHRPRSWRGGNGARSRTVSHAPTCEVFISSRPF